MAIISPPTNEIQNLRPKLNSGELNVLQNLQTLDDTWKVYVQPKLQMSQPDFIVTHERYGVCIIEVKDWTYGIYRQLCDGTIEVKCDGKWQPTRERPRRQAHQYRKTVIERFFSMPDDGTKNWAIVRAAVVLPQYPPQRAKDLLRQTSSTATHEMHQNIAVWGSNALDPGNVLHLVSGYKTPFGRKINTRNIKRLEYHLAEPEATRDQRRPLRLSSAAKNLSKNPSMARIRRARGPAGSGKSLGLSARAAVLAAQGKKVLVLSYNITLPHYLHDLSARHGAQLSTKIRNISFTHFHGFCLSILSEHHLHALPDGIEELVNTAISAYDKNIDDQFDAILVDEGQDFKAKWWNFLRGKVLKDGGEMLLVADTTQDLYERRAWTNEASMIGCGFRGPWTQLEGSYRLPPDLIPIISSFGKQYLSDGDYDPPVLPDDHPMQQEAAEMTHRSWKNIASPDAIAQAIADELLDLLNTQAIQPADIVFLCEEHKQGLQVVNLLKNNGVSVMHVFTKEDDEERRKNKHRFWGGVF